MSKTDKKDRPVEKNKIQLKDGTSIDILDINAKEEAIKRIDKGEKPWDKFIDILKDEEINRRVKMLTRAFDDYDKIINQLKEIKPDVQETFKPTGEKFPSRYSSK